MTVSAAQGRPVLRPSRSAETQWLDIVRVVAIAAVVMIHTVASIITTTRGADLAHPRWWLGNVVDSLCRPAVPLFIMVSGALLLASGRRESARDFYARRFQRIGVPLAFWSLAYLAFRRLIIGADFTVHDALTALARATPYFHLYFLFIIAGLYLATPALRIVVDHASRQFLVCMSAGLIVMGALDQALSAFFGAGQLNAVTYALPYAGYYLAGHLLATCAIPTHRLRSATLVFLGSSAATAVGTWFLAWPKGWTGDAGFLYGYLSPTVVVASLAAFVMLRALPERFPLLTQPSPSRGIRRLSELSFGLYLMHPLVQYAYGRYWPATIHPSRAPALLGALLTQWAVLCLVTLVTTALLRRVPLLRRVL